MGLAYKPRFSITSTPVVQNNDAYDANDVVVDTTELAHSMFSQYSGPFLLEQINFWDSNDQAAAALTIVFLNSNVTYGTKDAAPSISDANSLFLTSQYVYAAASILDVGGAKFGSAQPNILVQPDNTTGKLWYAIASAGTPTYLTGCLQLQFFFSA